MKKDLKQIVCQECGVSIDQFDKRTRKAAVKNARFLYYYILSKCFKYSASSISRIVGYNEKAIRHGVAHVDRNIKSDTNLSRRYTRIYQDINSSIITVPADPKTQPMDFHLVYMGEMYRRVTA